MTCAGCGTGDGPLVPSPACAQHALTVAEREFSDQAYFAVHRITVAAYVLQHPDASSDHAVAVHLAALPAEADGLGPDAGRRRLRWAAEHLRAHPPGRLARPARRGTRTIADVVAARTAEEHCATVTRWAGQVWTAWHAIAQDTLPAG
ncbi:DUF5946 family protein [Pseudonocardia sp. GCM10023141]|uniref:DUF5946 family protein n=1 Tax=Pseudonocardia sp. GCM10023141 TaxID=3252653 RepID=UPI00361514FE